MKFEYVVDVKEGYKQTMQLEESTEIRFTVDAKNRVTADRMIKALLKGASNVVDIIGVCVD